MTGDDLKLLRKARGLSRPALAALAGVHPDTVKYWEGKATVDLRGHAPDRLLHALGLGGLSQKGDFPRPRFFAKPGDFCAVTRARGGVLRGTVIMAGPKRCGARTRKGTPCRAKVLPGKARCRFHGGLSTGPKTVEGRDRIAEAQRRRWARWRIEGR